MTQKLMFFSMYIWATLLSQHVSCLYPLHSIMPLDTESDSTVTEWKLMVFSQKWFPAWMESPASQFLKVSPLK